MKKAELIIITLSIIALGLDLFFTSNSFLALLPLIFLSMFYMYLSFAIFNGIRLRNILKKESYTVVSPIRIIGAIGTGFALSTTIFGIISKFQCWPGASSNISVGLLGLLIITIIGLIKYSKNKSEYYTRIFKRIAIFGGLGLILFLIPNTSLMEIKYRKHPDYVNAYKKASEDPKNTELWDKVEVERQKMNNEN